MGLPTGLPKLRLVDEAGKRKPLKFAFTVAELNRVNAPAKGRVFVYDAKQPGLALAVTASGARAFYFYRKVNGRPLKLKLGDYPGITIEQARKLTLRHIATVAEGGDPAEDRRATRGELTLRELRELYQENHAKLRCSERTIVSEDSLWTTTLGSLHARRLTAIKSADVAKLHGKLAKDRGRRTANRAVQYLRRLYRYAAKHYGYRDEIPTEHIDLFEESSRERFLSADELPRFLAAVEEEPQPFRDWFKLALFTGARSANVRSMRWEHIDLKAGVWTIPADESKNATEMKIPLVGPVPDILKCRFAERNGSDYVFPVQRNKGKHPYISQPSRAFERVCKAAGITGLRIHDLRRSMGAWQAIGGASLPIIGRSLGHRDQRATAIYARLSDDPVRQSMAAAAEAMAGAGKEAKPDKRDTNEAQSAGNP